MPKETLIVDHRRLADFCLAVLATHALAEPALSAVCTHLLEANLLGIDSHGIQQLPGYTRSLNNGRIHKLAQPKEISNDAAAIMRLDGDGGAGHYVAQWATDRLIVRARQTGIAIAAVSNSNHFGMAGYYTRRIAAAGMVGFATSDTNVADLAPYGGRELRIGNNAVSWALPTGSDTPVVLDTASGTVSGGKVKHFAYAGLPMPPDWAIDADGLPTTEADKAQRNIANSYKGSAMALICDLLCGPLLGTASSFFKDKAVHDSANGTGHVILAMDIRHFTEPEAFNSQVQRTIQAYKDCAPVDHGTVIDYPGEREIRTRHQRLQHGIPLPLALLATLENEYGKTFTDRLNALNT